MYRMRAPMIQHLQRHPHMDMVQTAEVAMQELSELQQLELLELLEPLPFLGEKRDYS
jgi:hypothetical protein